MTITAAADGSALGNPGPAGWAWYIDDDCWRAGGWPHGTNNMGELKAVLDLLEATAVDADQHLHVLCDSQYVINSVTKWMPGWKRKGWRKKDGKPVMNVELLKAIDVALQGRSVEFEWVRGHAGHRMNEAADARANAAATAFQRKQDPKVGPGYAGRGGAPDGRTALLEETEGAPDEPAADAGSPGSAPSPDPALDPAASASHAPDDASAADPAATTGSAPRAGGASADADLFSLFDEPAPDDAGAPAGPCEPALPDAPFEEVLLREQALLSDRVRSDRDAAAHLLHADFTEIGASGREYDRAQILDALAPLAGAAAEDFVADEVAPGAVLVRFTTSEPERGLVRRSSLWVLEQGEWLLRHHQGTLAS